tara:strand:+ start:287 stop:802 length:516 start_codon:yes stop_codon:yes gene_type:complete
MRKVVFLICLMMGVFGLSAQVNNLSKPGFYQISIDGNTLESIQNTKGKNASVVAMFGTPVSAHNDPDREFSNYDYNGFEIGFSSILPGATFQKPIISSFTITSSNWVLNIDGKPVKVGDAITVLGVVQTHILANGDHAVVYEYCQSCNNTLMLIYNPTTNKVTKISFFEIT